MPGTHTPEKLELLIDYCHVYLMTCPSKGNQLSRRGWVCYRSDVQLLFPRSRAERLSSS